MPIPAVFQSDFDNNHGVDTDHPYQPEQWPLTAVYLEAPSGKRMLLTDRPAKAKPCVFIQSGPTGFDMPAQDFKFDESPNLDGGMFRSSRMTTREIGIPLYIYGADRRSVIELKKELFSLVNPKNGACKLVVSEAEGTHRYLEVHYVSGAEGNEGTDTAGFTWIKYVLVLRAMDPYWYTVDEAIARWSLSPYRPTFLSTDLPGDEAFLPLQIADGSLEKIDSNTVRVDSDVETWPVWEIRGPMIGIDPVLSALTFRNETTGKEFKWKPSFKLDNQFHRIEIDTRPGYKTIEGVRYDPNTGEEIERTNYWKYLGPSPQLWPLIPGDNEIAILGASGLDVYTRIDMRYKRRYFSYTG